jgi:hypothetical protein
VTTAELIAHPPETAAEYFYDYAGQDPVNNYDLSGEMTGGPGAPTCAYWHCGIDSGSADDPFWSTKNTIINVALTVGLPAGALRGAAEIIGAARAAQQAERVTGYMKAIQQYVGTDARVVENASDDVVLISKDGARRVRIDYNNPAPHADPHVHIDWKVNGKWRTKRIFPGR